MNLLQILHRLALVMERANEFIDANAPQMLPDHRTKMIDMGTISLMQYEDHVFHWDQLKNIVTFLIDKRLQQTPGWYIDMDSSTSQQVVIKSTVGHHPLTLPIDTFMMTMQFAAN